MTRKELANAIRALSMDAVQKANSGHPGAPMGMADIAEVLWNDFLRHNPTDPTWYDRDPVYSVQRPRLNAALQPVASFRLRPADRRIKELPSAPFEDARAPEIGYTPGVETTTGPLGQGFSQRRRHGHCRAYAGSAV